MSKVIKSGKEILDEFFEDIVGDEKFDQATVGKLIELYEEDKLTDKNLTNALSELRETYGDGED